MALMLRSIRDEVIGTIDVVDFVHWTQPLSAWKGRSVTAAPCMDEHGVPVVRATYPTDKPVQQYDRDNLIHPAVSRIIRKKGDERQIIPAAFVRLRDMWQKTCPGHVDLDPVCSRCRAAILPHEQSEQVGCAVCLLSWHTECFATVCQFFNDRSRHNCSVPKESERKVVPSAFDKFVCVLCESMLRSGPATPGPS